MKKPKRSATKTAAAAPIVALARPALARGELYAGAIIGPDGKGAHVVLLPGDENDITWPDAMAWAKRRGGDLPDRVEQALLFAHHKDKFEPRVYWSNTQYAADSAYAWGQDFTTGSQDYWRKGSETKARAVRRVPIQ
jgi:hypothetical protein